MSEVISYIISNGTTAATIGAVAGLFLVVVLGTVFATFFLTNYKHRSNSDTWYHDQVIAFKAGYIIKSAKEKEITLLYPPKTDLMAKLEEDVSNDLSK